MGRWDLVLGDRVITSFTVGEGDSVVIGRGKGADISIDNAAVSRRQASLSCSNGVFILTDLGSINGTIVNGEKIDRPVTVSATDKIEIAKFSLVSHEDRPKMDSAVIPADFEATVFIGSSRSKDLGGQQGKGAAPGEGCRLLVERGRARPSALSLGGRSIVKIGTDVSSDLCIAGWLVGKVQCFIVCKDGKYYLEPQGGWRSTTLNGHKVRSGRQLRSGDVIGIAAVKLKFE